MDVSEGMLRRAAQALLRDYPRLRIHAHRRRLRARSRTACRPVADAWSLFLGSTIGNLTPAATADFLRALRRQLVAAATTSCSASTW